MVPSSLAIQLNISLSEFLRWGLMKAGGYSSWNVVLQQTTIKMGQQSEKSHRKYKHQSFVYTQFIDQTVQFQTIQFSVSQS